MWAYGRILLRRRKLGKTLTFGGFPATFVSRSFSSGDHRQRIGRRTSMVLFCLLLVPLGLGLAGLFFSNGRVTLKEFLVHEASMLLLIGAAYFLALCNRTSDTEVWNGVVASKDRGTQGCCHSYP